MKRLTWIFSGMIALVGLVFGDSLVTVMSKDQQSKRIESGLGSYSSGTCGGCGHPPPC